MYPVSLRARYMDRLKELCKDLGGKFKESITGLEASCIIDDFDVVAENLDKILEKVVYLVDGKNVRGMSFKGEGKELSFTKIADFPMYASYYIHIGDVEVPSITKKREIDRKLMQIKEAVEREGAEFDVLGLPYFEDTEIRKILGLGYGATFRVEDEREIERTKKKLQRVISLLNRFRKELF